MATSGSSTSFNKTKQTQAAAQITESCVHNSPKQSTKDSQKADNWIILGLLKHQVKKKSIPLPVPSPQVTQAFWTPFCFASFTNMWAAHYRWGEICSPGLPGLLFFSLRWWKVDWFALILWPVPAFPFTSPQILWDTNCIGCQTFMASSATFTMCLSQFEPVCCSVSVCQERWRLFYGCTDDCLALCAGSDVPWFAMQLPAILPRDSWSLPLLFTFCHLLSQGLGLLVRQRKKS